MNVQYISDRAGHTTGVQIQMPIDEWIELKKKYHEFEDKENESAFDVPDWQIELGIEELKKVQDGTAGLQKWDDVKKQLGI